MDVVVGGVDVSRETLADLQAFTTMVNKWTKSINLISPSSVDDIWNRHIVDSAQIYRLVDSGFKTWVDLGSGGGFPGIVVATIAKSKNPSSHFTLIESDQRKATFLRTAARELRLRVSVVAERIEHAAPQMADIVSARALSPLSALLPEIQRHLKPQGKALLHKGKRYNDEIAEARQSWRFDLEDYPSMTDPDGRLLVIQRISRD